MHLTFCRLISIGSLGLLVACAPQTYTAKPLDVNQSAQQRSQQSLTRPDFKAYLIRNGIAEAEIPFQAWTLNTLTHAALFYHTDLAVAKEKLALAEYSIQSAGLKPALGVSGSLARSDRANGDINPMAYGLQLDIPFETTSKRALKVEEAQHLAEVARIDAAEIAWRLRQQLQLDLIDYAAHQRRITLLQQEVTIYRQLTDMMRKRVTHGVDSNTALAQYQLTLQKSEIQLRNELALADSFKIKLATDAGLTLSLFNSIPVASLTDDVLAMPLAQPQADALQSQALINRMDIRRGLARYAAAESRLKLEIAKQIPDITLTPGYIFEFGDRVWSLGLGTLLNLLQQQPTLIREAEQLRTIEGAQFEALQSAVIAQVSEAQAQYHIAMTQLNNAKESLVAQQASVQKIQKQFDLGLADRLTLTQAQLALSVVNQSVNSATFAALKKRAHLETVIQRPLSGDDAFLHTVMHHE